MLYKNSNPLNIILVRFRRSKHLVKIKWPVRHRVMLIFSYFHMVLNEYISVLVISLEHEILCTIILLILNVFDVYLSRMHFSS